MKKILASLFVLTLLATPAISRAGFFDLFKFDWSNMGAQAKVAVTAEVKKDTFVRGDRGAEISYIQTILAKKGYYTGKINGLIGIKTETAIKNWQLKNGLKATGLLDKATIESIVGIGQGASRGGGWFPLNVKVLLGGAYNPQTGLMSTALNDANLIPAEEPYSDLNYYMTVGGSDTTEPEIFDVTGPDAIVDWVVVQLRNRDDMKDVRYSKAALLQADGDVVAEDGVSPISVWDTNDPDQDHFYVLVGHRNHLPVITAAPINLTTTGSIDLTSASLFEDITLPGTAAKLVDNKQVLWPGDVNDDRIIKYTGEDNDRDTILSAVGADVPTNVVTGQYRLEDVNMDGVVKYVGENNDRDIILQSIGGSTPNNTLTAQIPELYPVNVQLISHNLTITPGGGASPDVGTFNIRFKVTNLVEGDIVIPSTLELTDSTHLTNEGVEYSIASDAWQGATVVASSLVCNTNCSSVIGGYEIAEGENSEFTITAALQPVADGFFKIYLNSINWGMWNGAPLNANEYYIIDLGQNIGANSPFSTDYIFLNAI